MTGLKWGLIDRRGDQVVPCRYDFLWGPSEGGVFPAELNGKWRYYKLDESVAFAGEFEDASTHSEGLAVVQVKGKQHFIDESGIPVGTEKFESLEQLSEGVAVATKGDLYGYVDRRGMLISPLHFRGATAFSCGRGLVQNEPGQWGFIDDMGKIVIPFQFDEADSFGDGLAFVVKRRTDRKVFGDGYIDLAGNYAFKAKGWGCGGRFSDGLAAATFERDGKLLEGYLNRQGEIAIEPAFDRASIFREGRGSVKIGRLWGAVDLSGRIAIKPRFKEGIQFHQGLAEVEAKNKRKGYIGLDGEEVIPPRFDFATDFWNDYARVAMRE